jgi:putative glutamine amidotransferase
VHSVSVVEGTSLEQILGTTSVEVNSLHHQAVDVLGDDLVVVARAHDGMVEGIAAVRADERVVGVQWHPELLLETPGGAELFDWLIEEAAQPAHGEVTTLATAPWTTDADTARAASAVA